MTTTWSLPALLAGLHDEVERRLGFARGGIGHPVAVGDASEGVWLEMLQNYLPKRYTASKAFVVDSEGRFSQQLDVVIYDRQYSPFILQHLGQTVVPAEGVYAAFEAKQSINAEQITYAQTKLESLRTLTRTSLPIPHAGGVYAAKPLANILGGILTFESDWSPPLGKALEDALAKGTPDNQLDLGCIAAHGHFARDIGKPTYTLTTEGRPATAFLFELIARLQAMATVPMIDIRAYARWLV